MNSTNSNPIRLTVNSSSLNLPRPNLRNQLSQIGQVLLNFLAGRTEPRIEKHSNRVGEAWWYVYDPLTGRYAYLDSETEVRDWLDRRHQC